MSKVLLLVVQSPNIDTYVNVLTHTVKHESVEQIFFGCNEAPPELISSSEDFIKKIYDRLETLSSNDHANTYKQVFRCLPSFENDRIKKSIIRLNYVNPHLSIADLKERFKDQKNLIIDITGTTKQLSSELMISCLVNNFENISHFVLSDKASSNAWRDSGKSKLYHDLINVDGVNHYSYANFAESQSIIKSLNKLKNQGKIIRILLTLSGLLIVAVVILIKLQKSDLAFISALISLLAIIFSSSKYLMRVFWGNK